MPSHIVENTWKEVGGMAPWQVPELVDNMGKQQPAIIAYILAVDQDIFNQAERGNCFSINLLQAVLQQVIERTLDPIATLGQDMGINHGRSYVLVP